MSSLTPAEVRRIATLARLELTDAEVDRLTGELDAILGYAAQVQGVDTASIAADQSGLPHVATDEPENGSVVRADVHVPSLSRSTVLDEAPAADQEAGFFTVPRVLGT